MSAVTQWFHSHNPVNPGLYQRLNTTTGIIYYAVFDILWFGGALTAREALRYAGNKHLSVRQMDAAFPWRGLAEKPEAA
jgi:hypothetical protein